MAKLRKFLRLSVLSIGVTIAVAGCLLSFYIYWLLTAPCGYYEISSKVVPEYSFPWTLFYNHPRAYRVIDPALTPRLDKWMSTHQVPDCVEESLYALGGAGNQGYVTSLACKTTAGEEYTLTVSVRSVRTNDGRRTVTDWSVCEDGY